MGNLAISIPENEGNQHYFEGKRLYEEHNKHSDALLEFHQALKIYQTSNPQSNYVALCACYIGIILEVQGKLDESLHYHQIGLNIYKKRNPDSLGVAMSMNNIGIVLHKQNKLDEALLNYNKALSIKQ